MNTTNATFNGGQITTSITAPSQNTSDASIHILGNAVVTGTLNVGGQNISKTIDERLTVIEERLAILRPDPDLESRWDELKQARERYIQLEAEFRSAELVYKILKS